MIYMMRPAWASTGSSGARDSLLTVDDEGSVVAHTSRYDCKWNIIREFHSFRC